LSTDQARAIAELYDPRRVENNEAER
jgi:hypothetical protein